MRRLLFLLALILLSFPATICHAQNPVAIKIKQVGLEGVYKQGTASRIQIGVRNTTAQPLSFSLFASEISFNIGGNPVAETLRVAVSLAASEQRDVDIPLGLSYDQRGAIFVQARDASGKPIGHA